MKYYSTNLTDKYMDENIFQNERGGFFVDIGSYDGLKNNLTAFLEESRGWEGLCIDINEDSIELLRKNRNCTILQDCISDDIESKWIQFGQFSGLLNYYDKNRVPPNVYSSQMRDLRSIKSKSLTEILLAREINHIDLCVIDGMGSELCILNSIDFTRISISVIVIFTIRSISDFLQLWMKRNDYFLHKKTDSEQIFIKNEL